MSWQLFNEANQWTELVAASHQAPQLIFKHSTRCSISSMVLNRFEASDLFQKNLLSCWFLDLIALRELSNLIATQTGVQHESPQCIVLYQGHVIYAESHGSIDAKTILLKSHNK